MDGAAVGFGADMALACDLRVASTTRPTSKRSSSTIGLMPDGGGTFWLPRLIGTARAMKAMLLSEKLDAKELDALGLLASVVPPRSCGRDEGARDAHREGAAARVRGAEERGLREPRRHRGRAEA